VKEMKKDECLSFVKLTGKYGPVYINIDDIVGWLPGAHDGTMGSGSQIIIRSHQLPFDVAESTEYVADFVRGHLDTIHRLRFGK
jgi:hypothetical protein